MFPRSVCFLTPRITRRLCKSVFSVTTSSTSTTNKEINMQWEGLPNVRFEKAMKDAEKLVGYKPSYVGLRSLLSDEVNNLAVHLMRLVGSSHPIIQTVRKLTDTKEHNMMQLKALVVLLMSNAISQPDVSPSSEASLKIRKLSEVTQMMFLSSLIHQGILPLSPKEIRSSQRMHDLHFGNKVAILTGDFLLASASKHLASLKNPNVVMLMSTALGNLAEGHFISVKNVSDWKHKTFLLEASLDAFSCQSVILLNEGSRQQEEDAFEFGRFFAMSRKTRQEIKNFGKFNITECSLPVLLAFEGDEDKLEECNERDRLWKETIQRKGVERTRTLLNYYEKRALDSLSTFKKSDATQALSTLVKSCGD